MLTRLIGLLPTEGSRAVGLTAGGVLALIGGQKLLGAGLFLRGTVALERQWRERHPEFDGSLQHRWYLATRRYEQAHRDPTNRVMHLVGTPLMLGGVVSLLLSRPLRPLWLLGVSAFSLGWALNLSGHALFEKNAPAFADDPLSFIVGPIWDAQQVGLLRGARRVNLRGRRPDSTVTMHVGEPAQA
jgi:hypothetical protein